MSLHSHVLAVGYSPLTDQLWCIIYSLLLSGYAPLCCLLDWNIADTMGATRSDNFNRQSSQAHKHIGSQRKARPSCGGQVRAIVLHFPLPISLLTP